MKSFAGIVLRTTGYIFTIIHLYGCTTGAPSGEHWKLVSKALTPICDRTSDLKGPYIFATEQDCLQSSDFKRLNDICDGCDDVHIIEFEHFVGFRQRFRCYTKNQTYRMTQAYKTLKTENFGELGYGRCNDAVSAVQKKYVKDYFAKNAIDRNFLEQVFDLKVVKGLPPKALVVMLGQPEKIEKVEMPTGSRAVYRYGRSSYFFDGESLVDWEIFN